MTKKEIATIPTGEKSAVKVTLVAQDGKFRIDVRHMFKDDFDKWLHTKKGIHVHPDVATAIVLAINKALEEC